jgi:hypothetical protein
MVAISELLLGGGMLLISLVLPGARWVLYEKACVADWASLIPIYSSIKRSEIAGGAMITRHFSESVVWDGI